MITLQVVGKPATQESKQAGVNPHTGRAFIREDNPRVKTWRGDIRELASKVMEAEVRSPYIGRVALDVEVVMGRSASHLLRDGFSLASNAPMWPRYPDLDKTLRAVLDALTGIVYLDDSQVVAMRAFKRFSDGRRPDVTVIRVAAYEEGLW